MLHPQHSRYAPDPSKEAIFPSNSHQHVQWTQVELGSSVVIFLHSLQILSPSGFVCLQPWYHVLARVSWWWLVWSRWVHRSATACFFRNTGTTSINFPVWYHRWWSNFCEFQGRKTPWASLMDWKCLYLVQAAGAAVLFFLSRRLQLAGIHIYWISGIRHVWFKQVLCNNLSLDLVHCGEIGFPHNVPPSAAPQEL